jgi:hypothetical protein
MDTDNTRTRVRLERLRRLAADHALTPEARTPSGRLLDTDLANPARIDRWCAVVYLLADRRVLLDAHHPSPGSARQRCERGLGEPLPAELPLEIVDLDTGARRLARLVARWRSPRA